MSDAGLYSTVTTAPDHIALNGVKIVHTYQNLGCGGQLVVMLSSYSGETQMHHNYVA